MIEKVINKIENNENIFVKVNEDVINKINIENLPESFKKYLTNCSVETFYEYETENILIRFNNINDIITENTDSYFLDKGFFIFADNSICDIYLLDISKQGNGKVYLSSRDILDNG